LSTRVTSKSYLPSPRRRLSTPTDQSSPEAAGWCGVGADEILSDGKPVAETYLTAVSSSDAIDSVKMRHPVTFGSITLV